MTQAQIADCLCALPPGEFELLLVKLQVSAAILSGHSAPQATRAAEVVKWAAAQGRMEDLAALLPSVSPQDVWERDLQRGLKNAAQRRSNLAEGGEPIGEVDREIRDLRRRLSAGRSHQVGELFAERYLLTRKLGQGGFAEVWRATDKAARAPVALKILLGSHAGDAIRRERFLRGARKMSEIDHPAIARVIAIGPDDDEIPHFAMELFDGGDLRQATLDNRIPRERVLSLILEVGGALAAAHAGGFIHRDVKPANVLLRQSGEAALSDFDLVAYKDTDGGTRTGVLGTVAYAAPETLTCPQEADASADVYGLAMTAIFCFRREEVSADVLRGTAAIIDGLAIDPRVKAVLKRATLHDRRRRYANATEFCDALADVSGGAKAAFARSSGTDGRNVLVWTAMPGRAPETLWLRLSASGDGAQIAGVRRGRWIAYRDRLYEWQTSLRPIQLLDPADMDALRENGWNPSVVGRVDASIPDAHLVDVLSTLRVPVTSATPEPLASSDVFEMQRWMLPLGSLPRYVFIYQADYTFGGGAHGHQGCTFRVLDLESVTYVDPLLQDESSRLQQRHGKGAYAKIAERCVDALFPRSDENGLPSADLTLVYPIYDRDGRLRLACQFTTGACYAASDHQWDSYSVSITVTDEDVPCLLRPYERLSAAVLRVCPAINEADVRMGWSEVTSAAVLAWLESFFDEG